MRRATCMARRRMAAANAHPATAKDAARYSRLRPTEQRQFSTASQTGPTEHIPSQASSPTLQATSTAPPPGEGTATARCSKLNRSVRTGPKVRATGPRDAIAVTQAASETPLGDEAPGWRALMNETPDGIAPSG